MSELQKYGEELVSMAEKQAAQESAKDNNLFAQLINAGVRQDMLTAFQGASASAKESFKDILGIIKYVPADVMRQAQNQWLAEKEQGIVAAKAADKEQDQTRDEIEKWNSGEKRAQIMGYRLGADKGDDVDRK